MWTGKPGRGAFTAREWQIVESHNTPLRVQRLLTGLTYNRELQGGTLRTFRQVLRRGEAHCLEAALTAATILEQYDYPPLVLSLASRDKLDHVVYLFRHGGLWGAIGRSRDTGLHGRRPVFRNVRQLVWSYFDPYVDTAGRIVGYGVGNLYELGGYDWRFAEKNVWKVERYLQEMPHRALRSSERRYRQLLARYKEYRRAGHREPPTYFAGKERWMM